MHQNVSHLLNNAPWSLSVFLLELLSKLVNGLSYYLYVIYGSVQTQFVLLQVLLADILCVILYAFYRIQHMLQASFVSFRLSHI